MNLFSHHEWKCPSVKSLCASAGLADPYQVIQKRVDSLILQSGIQSPPFSPFELGMHLGVRRVSFRPIGFDACLIPAADGFEVVICSHHSRQRQNFSMAHELGHLFLLEASSQDKVAPWQQQGGDSHFDKEEEHLCDYAASELLMPSRFFFRDVRYSAPSIQTVFELARKYDSSLKATMLKFVEIGLWKCAFVTWTSSEKAGAEHFLPSDILRSSSMPLTAGNSIEMVDPNHLSQTLSSRTIVRGRIKFRLGGRENACYMESMRTGSPKSPQILSMILAEPHAVHLACGGGMTTGFHGRDRSLFDGLE